MRFSMMLGLMTVVFFSSLPARVASIVLPSSVIVVLLQAIDAARCADDALVIKVVIDHLMTTPLPLTLLESFCLKRRRFRFPKALL